MGLRRIINKSIVIGTLALSVVFSANCIYAANIESMENFETTKTYDDGMFNDVPSSAWYATGVKDAYEYGLMGGKAKGVFDPKGNITVAECIVVASRINAIYKTGDGSIAGVQGGAWYDGAVKYAKDNGIIKNGEFSSMKKLATRAEMLSILRRSLPFTDSDVINKVSKIPDMPSSNKYYADVLIMYNLGITGGSDTKGTSNYNNNITRAEAATMFVRMAEPSSRVKVDFSNQTQPTQPKQEEQQKETQNETHKVGSITTKYGTHTYGCDNQAEYDAVVNIVEGVKNSDKYKDYVNQLVNNKSKRDEYLELKHLGDLNLSEQDAIDLGKMCILQDLTFQSLDGSKGMKTTSKGGDSAYNKLIERKTDCTGDAMVYSLIYDVAGFNTIVVGGHNHAGVRVQVSSGNWYSNLGEGLKKAGGTFQFSLTSETFD